MALEHDRHDRLPRRPCRPAPFLPLTGAPSQLAVDQGLQVLLLRALAVVRPAGPLPSRRLPAVQPLPNPPPHRPTDWSRFRRRLPRLVPNRRNLRRPAPHLKRRQPLHHRIRRRLRQAQRPQHPLDLLPQPPHQTNHDAPTGAEGTIGFPNKDLLRPDPVRYEVHHGSRSLIRIPAAAEHAARLPPLDAPGIGERPMCTKNDLMLDRRGPLVVALLGTL